MSRQAELAAICGLAVLASVPRALPVLGSGFPLLDGGLFSVMIRDLLANGFVPPAVTSYNGGSIPFIYPPLAIYLGAGLASLGIDVTQILRWVPLGLSVATVPAVYLLVRELRGQRIALASSAAYALMPGAFEWLITGGGLTRSAGVFFAVLALWMWLVAARLGSRWRALFAGLLAGLAVLTHPQAAVFVALGLIVMAVARWRERGIVRSILFTALAAIATALPWLLFVAASHGLAPLLDALASRSLGAISLATALFLDITGAPFAIFLGFAVIGIVFEWAERRALGPVWLLLTLLAIPTPAPAVGDASLVEIPMAMLIGIAVVEVVAPAVMSTTPSVDRTRVLIVGLLGAGLLAAVGFPMATQTGLYALTVEQRAAMRWVAESLPVNARFAVVTGRVWPQDAVSEWFPALSGRVSLGTPQGFEWTTAWQSRVNAAVRLQSCATQAQSCLRAWADEYGRPGFVFVPKGPVGSGPGIPADCCPALRLSLSPSYPMVYDGPGATIFAIR